MVGPDPLGVSNTASSIVASEVEANGPNMNFVSACASGTHALGEAYRVIAMGDADVMLAGGTEACITPLTVAGFTSMRAMCTTRGDDSPQTASRPFDADRSGFVMGEGAGVLLLESEEHAKARGAKIYCELAGYNANCDAFHITAPHPEGEGMSACLLGALDNAGLKYDDVDYINAHGTSTPLNDKFETLAYRVAFKEHAPKIKISSTKGAIGHLLGAAGGVEAAICCKVLEKNQIPPTINYNTPDPDCDLDYVPNVKYVPDRELEVAIWTTWALAGTTRRSCSSATRAPTRLLRRSQLRPRPRRRRPRLLLRAGIGRTCAARRLRVGRPRGARTQRSNPIGGGEGETYRAAFPRCVVRCGDTACCIDERNAGQAR